MVYNQSTGKEMAFGYIDIQIPIWSIINDDNNLGGYLGFGFKFQYGL